MEKIISVNELIEILKTYDSTDEVRINESEEWMKIDCLFYLDNKQKKILSNK